MKYVISALATIAGLLLISFLLAWPVQFLWNECLVGAIDSVQKIGWLQAWGLQFLVALLLNRGVGTKKD